MGGGLGFAVVGEECGTLQEYDYTGFFHCPPTLAYEPGFFLFREGSRFWVVCFQIQDFVCGVLALQPLCIIPGPIDWLFFFIGCKDSCLVLYRRNKENYPPRNGFRRKYLEIGNGLPTPKKKQRSSKYLDR